MTFEVISIFKVILIWIENIVNQIVQEDIGTKKQRNTKLDPFHHVIRGYYISCFKFHTFIIWDCLYSFGFTFEGKIVLQWYHKNHARNNQQNT